MLSKDHWSKYQSVRAGPCEGGFLGRGQGDVVTQKFLEDAVEGDGPGGGGGGVEAVDGGANCRRSAITKAREPQQENTTRIRQFPSLLGRSAR